MVHPSVHNVDQPNRVTRMSTDQIYIFEWKLEASMYAVSLGRALYFVRFSSKKQFFCSFKVVKNSTQRVPKNAKLCCFTCRALYFFSLLQQKTIHLFYQSGQRLASLFLVLLYFFLFWNSKRDLKIVFRNKNESDGFQKLHLTKKKRKQLWP